MPSSSALPMSPSAAGSAARCRHRVLPAGSPALGVHVPNTPLGPSPTLLQRSCVPGAPPTTMMMTMGGNLMMMTEVMTAMVMAMIAMATTVMATTERKATGSPFVPSGRRKQAASWPWSAAPWLAALPRLQPLRCQREASFHVRERPASDGLPPTAFDSSATACRPQCLNCNACWHAISLGDG